MYDRVQIPKSTQIIGFAYDIALEIKGKHLKELVRTSNSADGMVRSWIARIGLKLADKKTDVVLISSRKKMEFITITVGDQRITSKRAIKSDD